jgi:hypothetical protein
MSVAQYHAKLQRSQRLAGRPKVAGKVATESPSLEPVDQSERRSKTISYQQHVHAAECHRQLQTLDISPVIAPTRVDSAWV